MSTKEDQNLGFRKIFFNKMSGKDFFLNLLNTNSRFINSEDVQRESPSKYSKSIPSEKTLFRTSRNCLLRNFPLKEFGRRSMGNPSQVGSTIKGSPGMYIQEIRSEDI